MILKENISTTKVIGDVEKTTLTVREQDIQHLVNLLSTNLYSDPISSIVREITSNAIDATIDAKVDNPVLVSIYDKDMNTYFSVQDFGTGISPKKFEELFRYFGASDKRSSNSYIGSFGIGRLSPLSYTDSFSIETVYDGVRYLYEVTKDGLNIQFFLISSYETEATNGTTVTIKIKSNYGEVYKFITAIEEQILFFNNVAIRIATNKDTRLTTRRGLEVRTSNYYNFRVLYKHGFRDSNLKIVILLGNVCYPIDTTKFSNFNKLSRLVNGYMNPNMMLGIKFPIGSLDITPNREQIIYSKESCKAITDAIDNLCDELARIVIKSLDDDINISRFIEDRNQRSIICRLPVGDKSLKVKLDYSVNEERFEGTFDIISDIGKCSFNKFDYYLVSSLVTDFLYDAGIPYPLYEISKESISKKGFVLGLIDGKINYPLYFCNSVSELKPDTKKWIRENYAGSYIITNQVVNKVKKDIRYSFRRILRGYLKYFTKKQIKFLIGSIYAHYDLKSIEALSNDIVPQEYLDNLKAERAKQRKLSPIQRKQGLLGYICYSSSFDRGKLVISSKTTTLDLEQNFIYLNKKNEAFNSIALALFKELRLEDVIPIYAVSNTNYKILLKESDRDNILTVKELLTSDKPIAKSVRNALYLNKNYNKFFSNANLLNGGKFKKYLDVVIASMYKYTIFNNPRYQLLSSYDLTACDINEILKKLEEEKNFKIEPTKELVDILDKNKNLIDFVSTNFYTEGLTSDISILQKIFDILVSIDSNEFINKLKDFKNESNCNSTIS